MRVFVPLVCGFGEVRKAGWRVAPQEDFLVLTCGNFRAYDVECRMLSSCGLRSADGSL